VGWLRLDVEKDLLGITGVCDCGNPVVGNGGCDDRDRARVSNFGPCLWVAQGDLGWFLGHRERLDFQSDARWSSTTLLFDARFFGPGSNVWERWFGSLFGWTGLSNCHGSLATTGHPTSVRYTVACHLSLRVRCGSRSAIAPDAFCIHQVSIAIYPPFVIAFRLPIAHHERRL